MSSLIQCHQVKEDKENKEKPSFKNFKRAVWHQSFLKLLEAIKYHSQTGFWIKCGDAIERLLFPFILILSADYQEQYVSLSFVACEI